MPAFLCVTHAMSRREETDAFCRGLSRYGFRFVCVHEQTDPQHRRETLSEAVALVALTCPAAVEVESVASDIRLALGRGIPVLCVSKGENRLDERFCATAEGGAVLIPGLKAETPDRHAVSLFVHRLFIRHLALLGDCFSAVRCVDDVYGRVVKAAVAAYKGDPEASYALGRAYERGEGVPQLEAEAARWIAKAARQGMVDACIHMGELYLAGRGIERSPEEAFRLFSEAARGGDIRGYYHEGLCYLRGLGCISDPDRGWVSLERAANEGYPPALYEMGLLCRDRGNARGHIRFAREYLWNACRLGAAAEGEELPLTLSPVSRNRGVALVTMRQLRRTRLAHCLSPAPRDLSSCFSRSRLKKGSLPEEALPGEASLSNARRKDGEEEKTAPLFSSFDIAEAAETLGELLALGDRARGAIPRPTRALAWYRYALKRGNAAAAYRLGDAYRRGYGVLADPVRGFRYFLLGADMGDVRSGFAVGVCYERGIGTAPDPGQAARYYETAALAGYPPAQNNLGGCYERGSGVVRDPVIAAEWYARAASELPEAACRLGLCYENGLGVEADESKACRLYETAVAGGHAYACYRLALCYDREALQEERKSLNPPSVQKSDAPVKGREGDLEGEESVSLPRNHHEVVRLLERATAGGVAEAAYALSLCYAAGLGVHLDEERSLAYLQEAADGGCIQACHALGLRYLEGRALIRDTVRGRACFARAVDLWRESGEVQGRGRHGRGILSGLGMTAEEAAGAALYMLGYCALYGIGDRGSPTLDIEPPMSEKRVEEAAEYFRQASHVDHVGGLTALGDLYAYGVLTSPTATPEDEALRYYMEATRVGSAREYEPEWTGDSPIDALMSLAKRSRKMAEEAEAEGDTGSAELARVQTWRSLAGCSELGSLDAQVHMAACAYYGYGTPKNHAAALWFLDKASHIEGGRVTASLYLGDLYSGGGDSAPVPQKAEEAYLRGIATPDTESECGAYTLRERREARRRVDQTARAEACYHLAILRALYFSEGEEARPSFPYLVKAVLMGHEEARRDLARMYAYETAYTQATSPKDVSQKREDRGGADPMGVYARHRLKRRRRDSETDRESPAYRSHEGWMTNYYTALWPKPVPFDLRMCPSSVEADRPSYVSAQVTPTMLVVAINYLGDCLFYGVGLTKDPVAAAACYREAAQTKLSLERGQSLPSGVVWAQYSYGWCLLRGIGVTEDPREGVRYLTMAARTHAEACYALGECYEQGLGVDVPDRLEAFRYYRKAWRLGYRKAKAKVTALEKQLHTEV